MTQEVSPELRAKALLQPSLDRPHWEQGSVLPWNVTPVSELRGKAHRAVRQGWAHTAPLSAAGSIARYSSALVKANPGPGVIA